MTIELALRRESFLAFLALERLIPGVRHLVVLEMRTFLERFAAKFTTEWRLSKYTGCVIAFTLEVSEASFAFSALVRDWTSWKLDYMTPVRVSFPSLADWFLCHLENRKV